MTRPYASGVSRRAEAVTHLAERRLLAVGGPALTRTQRAVLLQTLAEAIGQEYRAGRRQGQIDAARHVPGR